MLYFVHFLFVYLFTFFLNLLNLILISYLFFTFPFIYWLIYYNHICLCVCRRVEGLPARASSSSDHSAAVRVGSGVDVEAAAAHGNRRVRERPDRHGSRRQPDGDPARRREGTGIISKRLLSIFSCVCFRQWCEVSEEM